MEWQQIVAFYQIAKLGSFTKAAEATFRTQPALSQQIKSLEAELDCLLLERIGKRKLRLTEAGENFLKFAQVVLEQYGLLEASVNELKGLQKGHLRLAAPFTTLYHLLRDILPQYVALFPQVQLTVLDRSQQAVVELVKAGDTDLGLALESMTPKGLAVRRWQKVEVVLMTPKGHPLARAPRVTLKQIAQYPLILPPKSPRARGRQTLEAALQRQGLDYHVVMESSNVELSSLYVEMGLGISFATMARNLTLPRERNLEFIPLNHYFKPDYLAVVWRQDKILRPYERAFLDLLFAEELAADAAEKQD